MHHRASPARSLERTMHRGMKRNQLGKVEMVEVLLEAGGQEVAVAESGSRAGTPTEYAPTDMQSSVENVEKLTAIQEFYDGQSIFVTGGTGFLGKLLIEKLLRGCPGISCIYVLIRSKKGKDVLQRTEEMIEDPVFSTLREEQPKFRHRIVAIEGDCILPDLGISMTDRATLMREVSIVFHVAATVRFNEKIKSATAINVRSLKDAINLFKEMPKLRSFVHVSTAFANCLHNPIEERFYDPPIDSDKLIDLMDCMDEKLLDDITPQLLGTWPNTYVYTKSVAENVVKKQAGSIPIGIFRPGVVISTYQEPIPGWIDNMYGPIGIAAGAGMGLIRSHHCDGSIKANLVPGDLTINALIASAWDVANNRRSNEDTPIYNYVSKDNPITYDELKDMSAKYGLLVPTKESIWYYSFRNTKYRLVHLFYVYFLHLLPALIIDTVALCTGKQPRLLKIYNKIHKFMDVLSHFSTTEWKFTNERLNELTRKLTSEDRKLFFCDMKEIVWDTYFQSYLRGIRIYILKDPIETVPQARIKWQRLYWMHQTLKLVVACVFLIITWTMISRVLVTFGYYIVQFSSKLGTVLVFASCYLSSISLDLNQDKESYQIQKKMSTKLTDLGETNNNNISDLAFDENERRGTPIQEFYAGQKIFITGGTGFLGKVLIEKLLQSCPHVARLYLLTRPKKGKNAQARIEELFQDRVFDRIKKEVPKFRDKVVAICGDCSVEELGISAEDRRTLINEVSVVFHVAATVRFNEKLKLASAINVRSTNDLLELCKSMPKLKALVHVSTAYANCFEKRIEERFYAYSIHHEELIRSTNELSEEELENKFQCIKKTWPNTYTFTKAMAESLIREKHGNLPIGIIRPAIVISTAYEPIKGWLDNVYGPNGIAAAVSSGILRVMQCDPNSIADIIPVDITVNALIASAWDIYTQTNRRGNDMLIYNVVASVDAPLTWFDYNKMTYPHVARYPPSSILWYPTLTLTKYKSLYKFLSIFFHVIPAILVDTALICIGQKPRMRNIIGKITNFCDVIAFFSTGNWIFINNNVQNMWQRLNSKDQQLFKFSMANFDWKMYLQDYVKGIRLYIFKDELDNLESSKLKWKRLYWMHQVLKTFIFVGSTWTIWKIFHKIFS
ncbi:uncharacterized protein LOC122632366 [Vespula pensylvanica]|uniref:uncharacterized protein LOC122632366 n=1 Tax=Vespula pensylvanica TaxID=30213 RepID=UPI001CBA431A|nr:uncharacterized protein LOC122632366 [Vespula pensylvanica]